ncbi:phospholipase D-like domain-containing protein [Gilvimarinus sp. F26214L]|uniref:phospholipase D-like domain-containing protein n=1 Tax=Gilvimarinus sp. DZF01 TaxID=3461371 RepID=UPI004045451D
MQRLTAAGPRVVWEDYAWVDEQLFSENDLYFDALFASIDRARESILLATYIFQLDGLGREMIRHLRRARERGVNVRVVYDGVGAMEAADKIASRLEKANIPVRIFHPLPWQRKSYRRALRHTSWLGSFFLSLLRINQRQHAKICIVDNFTLWCGSQNVTSDHLSEHRGGKGWHDFGAMVSGPSVKAVADTFDDFWAYRRPRVGRGLFSHYWNNVTELARQRKNRLLATRIANASRRVWIVNPYFSPTRKIIRALLEASARGADVRIVVPYTSDLEFFPLLTSTYYDELIRHGVRIFEYLPSILHGKLMLADDFCLLGSTNLNHRSLLHDLEFDIVMGSTHTLRAAESTFLNDQSSSREVTAEHVKLMGKRRLLGWIPWLIRYWL